MRPDLRCAREPGPRGHEAWQDVMIAAVAWQIASRGDWASYAGVAVVVAVAWPPFRSAQPTPGGFGDLVGFGGFGVFSGTGVAVGLAVSSGVGSGVGLGVRWGVGVGVGAGVGAGVKAGVDAGDDVAVGVGSGVVSTDAPPGVERGSVTSVRSGVASGDCGVAAVVCDDVARGG